MSSIEEEDESSVFDEAITQIETLPLSQQEIYHSSSVLEWDSELSESEEELYNHIENSNDNGEEQAANRALQNFIQSCSRTVSLKKIFCNSRLYLSLKHVCLKKSERKPE
jgi:hypothetical protein